MALRAPRSHAEALALRAQPLLRFRPALLLGLSSPLRHPGVYRYAVTGRLSPPSHQGFYRCFSPARVLGPARELVGAPMTFSIRGGDAADEWLESPE